MKDLPVSDGPRTSVSCGPNSTLAGGTEAPTKVRWVRMRRIKTLPPRSACRHARTLPPSGQKQSAWLRAAPRRLGRRNAAPPTPHTRSGRVRTRFPGAERSQRRARLPRSGCPRRWAPYALVPHVGAPPFRVGCARASCQVRPNEEVRAGASFLVLPGRRCVIARGQAAPGGSGRGARGTPRSAR